MVVQAEFTVNGVHYTPSTATSTMVMVVVVAASTCHGGMVPSVGEDQASMS